MTIDDDEAEDKEYNSMQISQQFILNDLELSIMGPCRFSIPHPSISQYINTVYHIPVSWYPSIPYPVSQYPVSQYPVSRISISCIPYPSIPVSRIPYLNILYPVSQYPSIPYPVSPYPVSCIQVCIPVSRIPYPISQYPVSHVPVSQYPGSRILISSIPFFRIQYINIPYPVSQYIIQYTVYNTVYISYRIISSYHIPVSRIPYPVSQYPVASRIPYPVSQYQYPGIPYHESSRIILYHPVSFPVSRIVYLIPGIPVPHIPVSPDPNIQYLVSHIPIPLSFLDPISRIPYSYSVLPPLWVKQACYMLHAACLTKGSGLCAVPHQGPCSAVAFLHSRLIPDPKCFGWSRGR